VRESEVKKVLLENKPLYLFYCKNNILIANNSNEHVVPTSVEFLLHKYIICVPEWTTIVRGIKHHIDLILGVFLPN